MKILAVIFTALFVSGCASTSPIKSFGKTAASPIDINDSLPYFLPRKRLQLIITDDGKGGVSGDIIELPVEADPRALFYIKPDHSAFRSDISKITLDAKGLLKQVDNDSTGALPTFLPSAARLVGAGFGITQADDKCASAILCTSFDPADPVDLNRVQQLLPPGISLSYLGNNSPDCSSNTEQCKTVHSGVAYRLASRTRIRLVNNLTSDVIMDEFYELPQAGDIVSMPVHASILTQQKGVIDFVDGTPSAWSSERPSEAAALVALPGNVLKNFLEGPAELLTWRVDSKSSVIEQQNKLEQLRLQSQILEACLQDADATDSPNEARVVCYASFKAP